MYQSYGITTRPPRERFEFFRATIEEVFCPMDVQPRVAPWETFGGSMEAALLGEVRLARVATSACLVRRRAEDIQRISEAPYLVKFQSRGESVWTQRRREIHLRPGDFVLCSTSEPYELRFLGAYEMPVLALTPAMMRRLTPDPDQFLGRHFNGQDADCGLLSGFVAQVAARMKDLRAPMIGRIEANIVDLLGGVLCARARSASVSAAQQLARVRAYIDEHLRDRRLSPATIAAAFGVSPRYLHTLFEQAPTTVGRYIRSRRVAACRRALENPAGPGLSLTQLALVWGFYDLSHMTRAFREELGFPPSAVRETVPPGVLTRPRREP